MTPFKKNVTESIDNLNRICKTILSVYDNETIDKMLNDNVLNQSGSDLTFNNTVAGGKFEWEIQGSCEQDGTPTPTEPIDVKVVTGDNDVVVSNSDNTQSQTITLHLGTNYLAGIDTYDDTIEGKTDNWKIKRYIEKVVLNGSEDWSIYNNFLIYTRGIYPAGASVTEALNGYCNQAPTDTNNYIGFTNNSKTALGVKNVTTYWGLSAANIIEWKTYLSTNNVVLYYQLAEETEETITDTTLISDLNDLYDLSGYDGQTNISITPSSGNATPSLKVTGFVTEKEV